MDYLASEISMQNMSLDGIHNELTIMNKQNNNRNYRRKTNTNPLQTSLDNIALSNKFKVEDINRIPSNAFKFECLQKVAHKDKNNEWRRYNLNPPLLDPMSHYLTLAYCIIKKDLKFEGYSPIEIAIQFEKGEVMDNEINIRLTKENINQSSIIRFANIIDFLDVKPTLFVLWTESKRESDKPRKRRQISGRVRQNVLMRDNYTCQICGATVKDGAKLEIDHIKPVSKGGTNKENNLQVLCQQCNREKHNRDDLLHDKKKLMKLNGVDEFEDICEDILREMHWYEKETGEEETYMGYLREEMIEIKNEDKISFEKSIERLIEKGICYFPNSDKIKMVGDYHDMLNLVKLEGK